MTDRRARRRPSDGHRFVAGEAELTRDPEEEHGWLLTIDGVPQSYVDLADPTRLEFEYLRLMGDVVDCLSTSEVKTGGPLAVVHVGGGACTLARYVAATRPGSRQLVFEPNATLVRLVREHLGLKNVPGLKLRVTDGRSGMASLPDDADDLVALDAFAGAVLPPELATTEFAREAVRVLRPGGVYMVNVADGAPLAFTRRMAATLRGVFAHVLLAAEPGVLRGRRFGNLILVASDAPLPVAELTRRAAGGIVRARCMDDTALAGFAAGAKPLHDGEPADIPVPPPGLFTER